ncbi:DNA polymerase III subunit gamma and tau [Streptomyces hirsutus]
MVEAFATGDGAAAFEVVDHVIEGGNDPRRFVTDLLERLRDLVILAAVPDAAEKGLIDVPADVIERMQAQAGVFGAAELSRAADLVNEGLTEMRGATSPRLQLELICARVLLPAAYGDERSVMARLDRIERGVNFSAGGSAAGMPAMGYVPGAEGHGGGGGAPVPPGGGPAAARAAVRGQGAPEQPQQPVQGPGAAAAAAQQPPAAAPAPAPAPAPPAPPAPAPAASVQAPAAAPSEPAPPSAPAPGAWPTTASAGGGRRPGGWPTTAVAGGGQAPAASSAPTPASAPASAPPSAPAPSGGGGSGLDPRMLWPNILEVVKNRRRFTWILLSQNAQVTGFDGTTLQIGFVNSGARDNFLSSGSEDVLRQALAEQFNVQWKIEAVIDPSGGGAAASAPSVSPVGGRGGGAGYGSGSGSGGAGGGYRGRRCRSAPRRLPVVGLFGDLGPGCPGRSFRLRAVGRRPGGRPRTGSRPGVPALAPEPPPPSPPRTTSRRTTTPTWTNPPSPGRN